MIVYVETNFLLQVALGQEQARAADDLLALAEQRRVTLIVPAFSLSEPFATLAQRERARRNLRNTLSEQLRQLRRSEPHQDAAAALEPLLQFLQGLEREEFGRLQTTVGRILATAHSVPFDSEVFTTALRSQEQFGLSPQDAIVYASVLNDLRGQPPHERKLFVSLNWRDFGDPGLAEELHQYGCRYEESIAVCLDQVRAS